MKRPRLEEDLQLIQKYFPGAAALSIETPFDVPHRRQRRPSAQADSFRAEKHTRWYGDELWLDLA